MTSKMSDCIYSGRKLESLQKSGLKTCAGALPLGVAACFAFRLPLNVICQTPIVTCRFLCFRPVKPFFYELWISQKNRPAAEKEKPSARLKK